MLQQPWHHFARLRFHPEEVGLCGKVLILFSRLRLLIFCSLSEFFALVCLVEEGRHQVVTEKKKKNELKMPKIETNIRT